MHIGDSITHYQRTLDIHHRNQNIIADYNFFFPDIYILDHWKYLKLDITKITKKIAKQTNIDTKRTEQILESNLESLILNKASQNKINDIQIQIDTIQAHTFKVALIRSRLDIIGIGERSHHCNTLERIHAHSKHIQSITHNDNRDNRDNTDTFSRLLSTTF